MDKWVVLGIKKTDNENEIKNTAAFSSIAGSVIRFTKDRSCHSYILAAADYDVSGMPVLDEKKDAGTTWVMDNVIISTDSGKERTVKADYGKYVESEGLDIYNHMVYPYGETVFEGVYDFGSDMDITYLKWLDQTDNIMLSFYDYGKNEYVRVMTDTDYMENDELENYLKNNVLKVSFEIVDLSDMESIPAFTVTGGDGSD